MPAPDAADLALVADAVREAGAVALEMAAEGVARWEKSPGNPVTAADLAIDQLLAKRLRSARPDYGWLSEESRDDGSRLVARRSFLVDPIDGTRDYARGRSGYAVSVAIVEDGEVRVGALFAPARSQLFLAVRGGGAVLNDEPLRVSSARGLAGARLSVDASTLSSRLWQDPWAVEIVDKPNAIALRIGMVASGAADCTFDGRPARDIDIAAAALILEEAGGRITDHTGQRPMFNSLVPRSRSLVAATPGVHEEMRARLADALARYEAQGRRR